MTNEGDFCLSEFELFLIQLEIPFLASLEESTQVGIMAFARFLW